MYDDEDISNKNVNEESLKNNTIWWSLVVCGGKIVLVWAHILRWKRGQVSFPFIGGIFNVFPIDALENQGNMQNIQINS